MTVKRIRNKLIAGGISFFILCGLSAGMTACQKGDTEEGKVMAEVNGIPIYQQEMEFVVTGERLYVRNKIMTENDISSEDFSWDQPYEGERTALDDLREIVLEECAYDKLLQNEAKEQGLLKQIDYPYLEEKRISENEQRQEMNDNNEVVYGNITYDARDYYEYMNSSLERSLQTVLEDNGTFSFSEEELQKLYQDNRDYFLEESYEDAEIGVKAMALEEAFEEYMQDKLSKAKIEVMDQKEVNEVLLAAVS